VRPGTPPQTLAVVFTDMVGSTELTSRIGDEAFGDLRRAHFAALRRAVDEAGGSQVKGTGDGILAVFGSAAAAVDCAVAIQQAIDVVGRDGVPLEVRVGVAVGDVSFEEGDVYGTAVVEAARLVSVARGRQILTTAVVRAVAGGRCRAGFTDLGLRELKGLPEPMAVCEVSWDALPTSTLPPPPLLGGPGRIFVGREAEMRLLARCWEAAAEGGPRTAVVGGEPGVGKTRLATEFASRLHAGGAIVLGGRCDEDLGVPFQPFVEALRHLVDHAPAHRLARLLGDHGGDLARLVPELGALVPELPPPLRSDPETERSRLFDAVVGWLAATAADRPVLLVVEDLQWAARPTLLLLQHVLRSGGRMRLLILATYRDTEVGPTHQLGEFLSDLRHLDTVTRVSLSGLAEPAVAAFLERAAGHPLGDDRGALARVVHRETEGNPLFVVEVVRHLVETGAVKESQGRWTTIPPVERLAIPEGVRDVIGRRVSRLSPAANRALAVAAVAGEEFEPLVVERAGGLDGETLTLALDEAVSARLVIEVVGRPEPRYRFGHALVRTSLYEDLTRARRVVLHRRVAEAIEDVYAAHLDDVLPALAHHYSRASAPQTDTAKAVDYAQRAGDRALAQLANDEAVAYYRQALEILDLLEEGDAGTRRVELLTSLGEAQRRAGDAAHRETLLRAADLARHRGDAAGLARAALANNRGFFSVAGGVDAERLAVLEAAVDAATMGDQAVRARLLANLAGELAWSPENERRDRLGEEALALARRSDDTATVGHALVQRMPLLVHTRSDVLFASVDELQAAASALQDPVLAFWSAWWRSSGELAVGDAHKAARSLDAAAVLASELKQPFYHWAVGYVRANLSRIAGDLAAAESQAREAFETGRSGGIPDAFRVMGVNLFWVRYDQGRLAELDEPLVKAAARKRPGALYLAALAFLHAELRRPAEARRAIDALAAGGFAGMPTSFFWLYGLTMAAAACAQVGDRARAAELYERLLPWRTLVAHGCAAASGTVAHHLGLLAGVLGRYEAADEHFAHAATLNGRVGAPTWQAWTRLEWARVLLAGGQVTDTGKARELLGQAVASARELGMTEVESRAGVLLAEAE
jgi:class 3 adenylate cyclase/tetratricopeptide (TPR) repeat protein